MESKEFNSHVVVNRYGQPMTDIVIGNVEYESRQSAITKFLNQKIFLFFTRNKWWRYYQWEGYRVAKVKCIVEIEDAK